MTFQGEAEGGGRRQQLPLRHPHNCQWTTPLVLLLLLLLPGLACDVLDDDDAAAVSWPRSSSTSSLPSRSFRAANASLFDPETWPSDCADGPVLSPNGLPCASRFSSCDERARMGPSIPVTAQCQGDACTSRPQQQQQHEESPKDGEEDVSPSSQNPSRQTADTRRVAGDVVNEYIVRFRNYRHASEHRRALERALGGQEGWNWIERHNPASAFPTDFGLLRIEDAQKAALLSRLAKESFVRDVSPQMRFTRDLLSSRTTTASDEARPGLGPDPAGVSSQKKQRGFRGARDARIDVKTRYGSRTGNFVGQRGNNKMFGAPPGASRDSETQGVTDDFQQQESEGKAPGRMRCGMSFEDDELWKWESPSNTTASEHRGRNILGMERSQITSMFEAEKLWARGFTGAKVRMAVFDTGVRADHPHFRNIKERTNWTNEKDILNDNLGHGTFVAGVISSQDQQCLGFAPDAEIYAFRVFTDAQVSYTSWFLDAFNYAIATEMNVLNLSIGGPDYLDSPFVEKVWEMTANNIIMVSAIGNDGPLYGTLNNPADQSDVIGVGGIDYSDHIASFSSRGMSTWELPHGYGRVKPDIVAYGREVIGSKITTGCKSLSGTSVASPVVAGGVCLLASVVPESNRWDILNPASMKQALVEGATQLVGPNIFEQGSGRLNLLNSFEILQNYKPRASIHPRILDLTQCPYMWPFCRQPLYHGAMPIIFNATILNGMGVVGYIESAPTWTPLGTAGDFLDIQFQYSDVIWPWTGYLGLHLRIKPAGNKFSGIVEGNISFTVVSPPGRGEEMPRRCVCHLPVKVAVIPTPERQWRILWDQFHSIRYPPGYIPRDSLDVRNDILDWHGDHMHTNFHGMFDSLRDAGYFLESLGSPLTCFDANQYGTLLMVDLEDEYHAEETEKLKNDVESLGLGLIVFADWYHLGTMLKMKFFDDNTRSWWTPATGGANIPALNDLLEPFGIAFGDTILNGAYSIGSERAHYASGTDLKRFPAGGFVHRFLFQDSSGGTAGITSTRTGVKAQVESPILGAVEIHKGRVAVYGDSNCLDSSHMVTNCYWLLKKLLDFTSHKLQDPLIFSPTNELAHPIGLPSTILPIRRTDINFSTYSLVVGRHLQCGMDAPIVVQGSKGFLAQIQSPRKTGNIDFAPESSTATKRQSMTSSDSKVELEALISSSPGITSSVVDNSTVIASGRGRFGSEEVSPQFNPNHERNIPVQIDVTPGRQNGEKFPDNVEGNTGGILNGDTVGNDSIDPQPSDGLIDRITRRKTKKEAGIGTGWRREEMDGANLVFQWLVPVTLCITGFLLFWSLWGVRQKKPRRVKKGSKSSLLTL